MALMIGSGIAGGAMTYLAFTKAREAEDYAGDNQIHIFDGKVARVHQQGKLYDTIATVLYGVAGLGAIGALTFAILQKVHKNRRRRTKASRLLIIPTVGPGRVGLTGRLRF